MSKTTELETVRFHQDTLYGTRINRLHHENGWDAYVAIRPICDNLGIGWHGQFERIKRDAVLSSTIRVIRTVAADGKQREMVMLPIEYLHGWLFGIDANRVKPVLKDKIVQYQRECYHVLARHAPARRRKTSSPTAPPNSCAPTWPICWRWSTCPWKVKPTSSFPSPKPT